MGNEALYTAERASYENSLAKSWSGIINAIET